jgi:hypothetical protein
LTDIFILTYPYLACAVFKLHRASRKIPVVHSERETPLPIPNRAVKPFSADGTWGATPWESRSPPVLRITQPAPSWSRAARVYARYRAHSVAGRWFREGMGTRDRGPRRQAEGLDLVGAAPSLEATEETGVFPSHYGAPSEGIPIGVERLVPGASGIRATAVEARRAKG